MSTPQPRSVSSFLHFSNHFLLVCSSWWSKTSSRLTFTLPLPCAKKLTLAANWTISKLFFSESQPCCDHSSPCHPNTSPGISQYSVPTPISLPPLCPHRRGTPLPLHFAAVTAFSTRNGLAIQLLSSFFLSFKDHLVSLMTHRVSPLSIDPG